MYYFHPAWDRSCAACESFYYRLDGTVLRDRETGRPERRTNDAIPTPCDSCPKVPDEIKAVQMDKPDGWREMRKSADDATPENRAFLKFFVRCRTVGRFPADPLSEHLAGVVGEVEAAYNRMPTERLIAAVGTLTAVLPLLVRR